MDRQMRGAEETGRTVRPLGVRGQSGDTCAASPSPQSVPANCRGRYLICQLLLTKRPRESIGSETAKGKGWGFRKVPSLSRRAEGWHQVTQPAASRVSIVDLQ